MSAGRSRSSANFGRGVAEDMFPYFTDPETHGVEGRDRRDGSASGWPVPDGRDRSRRRRPGGVPRDRSAPPDQVHLAVGARVARHASSAPARRSTRMGMARCSASFTVASRAHPGRARTGAAHYLGRLALAGAGATRAPTRGPNLDDPHRITEKRRRIMDPQRNKATLQRLYDGVMNGHDLDAADALITVDRPDHDRHFRQSSPPAGRALKALWDACSPPSPTSTSPRRRTSWSRRTTMVRLPSRRSKERTRESVRGDRTDGGGRSRRRRRRLSVHGRRCDLPALGASSTSRP